MKTPQRYELTRDEEISANPQGAWVKYSDFVVAVQEARDEGRRDTSILNDWLSPIEVQQKIAQLKQYANQERSNKLIDEVFGTDKEGVQR